MPCDCAGIWPRGAARMDLFPDDLGRSLVGSVVFFTGLYLAAKALLALDAFVG